MNKAQMVADVEALIAKWGNADVIRKALDFIDSVSDADVIARDYDSKEYRLSTEQKKELDGVYATNGKISTIKLFREMHSCGLREAKAAVEYLYEPARYNEYVAYK